MALKLWMLMCVASLTNGSSENITDSKRLFGSKMCAFLCRRTTGCSEFLFSDSTCVLNIAESSTEGGVLCTSNRDQEQDINMPEEQNKCCPKCYKIVSIRRQSPRCVECKWCSQRRRYHALISLKSVGPTQSIFQMLMFLTIYHWSAAQTPSPEAEDVDLILASRMGDLAKVKTILSEEGVDINFFEPWRMPAVLVAARSGHKEVVEFLVKEGADLSLVDQFGNNILHCACMGGDVKTVKYLLSQSVLDINSRGQHHRTPLMFAIFNRCHEVMELLVGEGADLSPVDDFGNNVLHCACIGDNLVAVEFLLLRGLADSRSKNKLGKTAVDLARDNGFDRLCNFLASYK